MTVEEPLCYLRMLIVWGTVWQMMCLSQAQKVPRHSEVVSSLHRLAVQLIQEVEADSSLGSQVGSDLEEATAEVMTVEVMTVAEVDLVIVEEVCAVEAHQEEILVEQAQVAEEERVVAVAVVVAAVAVVEEVDVEEAETSWRYLPAHNEANLKEIQCIYGQV